MGQILRINFNNKDYNFRILNIEPLTRDSEYVDLLLDGQPLKIVREGKRWIAEVPVEGITADLVDAIARNIILRFRL